MSDTDSTTPETPAVKVDVEVKKKKILGFIPRPNMPRKSTVIATITAFAAGGATVYAAQKGTGKTLDFEITTPDIDYDHDGNGDPLDVPTDS